jgi:NADPH-dependent glutamate synthase beta subunit-like oxidoreductase
MDNYTLDKCTICGKHKALKNGICMDCEFKIDIPEFFKDLFEPNWRNRNE